MTIDTPDTQVSQHELLITYSVTYSVLIEGTQEDAARFGEMAPSLLPGDDVDTLLLLATQDAGVVLADASDPWVQDAVSYIVVEI